MEVQVAIVTCKNCIFAQNAESILLCSLDSINKGDVGNISLRVTTFDLLELCHNAVAVTVRKAKVQIVIITHSFLDVLKNVGNKKYCQVHLNRILHSKGVICVLMRIESQEVLRSYTSLLPHFLDWNVLELRANRKLDPNFSQSFQNLVIQSYNQRTRHNESKIPDPRLNSAFWAGQSSGTLPGTSGTQCAKPLLLSTTSDEGREIITVKINEPVSPSDELRIQLRKGEQVYSTIVQIPDNLSPSALQGSIVQIEAPFLLVSHIFPNEDDPIQQMLSKFPGYKQYLDDHLSQALEQVYIAGSSLENLTLLQEFLQGRDELFPTVLHFAAYYGLKDTVVTLMSKEDGVKAFDVTNAHGETPLDISKRRGHDATIGQILREYEGLIYTWEAINQVRYSRRSTAVSLEHSVKSVGVDDSVFTNIEEERIDASTSQVCNELGLDRTRGEAAYVNIEVVPPDLPKRKAGVCNGPLPFTSKGESPMSYSAPPNLAIPVSTKSSDQTSPSLAKTCSVYSVPPREAIPASVPALDENYVPVYRDAAKGSTMERFNPNPIRASYFLCSTSSEDEDFPIYREPIPAVPPPDTVDEIPRKISPVLDAIDEELIELIKTAITQDLGWEQIEARMQSIVNSPGMLVHSEQNQKELELLRTRYRDMQGRSRKGKDSGIMERIFRGIKNAKRKISNNTVQSPSATAITEDETTPPALTEIQFSAPKLLSSSPQCSPRQPRTRKNVSETRIANDEERVLGKKSNDLLERRRKGDHGVDVADLRVNVNLKSTKENPETYVTPDEISGISSPGYVSVQDESRDNLGLQGIAENIRIRENTGNNNSNTSSNLDSVIEVGAPPPPRPPKKKEGRKEPAEVPKLSSPTKTDQDQIQPLFLPPKPSRRNVST